MSNNKHSKDGERNILCDKQDTFRCLQAGILSGGKWDRLHDIARRYYDPEGISPTVVTCGGVIKKLKSLKGMILNNGRRKSKTSCRDLERVL